MVEWDITPFSTDFLPGDVDGDGIVDAADITLLRRYIAANDKNAFKLANPNFDETNADINGDGTINAQSVALLRQYVAGFSVSLAPSTVVRGIDVSPSTQNIRIGQQILFRASVFPSTSYQGVTWSSTRDDIVSIHPSGMATGLRRGMVVITARSVENPNIFGRAGLNVLRPVTVDLFVEPTWIEHYGSAWVDEVQDLFFRARVPFYHTFYLDMLPTARTITLPWGNCPNTNNINQNCREERGCGSRASCRTSHHTSAVRIANHSLTQSNRDLSLVIVGHGICEYEDGAHYDLAGSLWGIARRGQKGAVARGYHTGGSWAFGYRNATAEVHRWNTIRTMQHELTHNYGATHCDNRGCIMEEDGSLFDIYEPRTHIWCNDCTNAMFRYFDTYGG